MSDSNALVDDPEHTPSVWLQHHSPVAQVQMRIATAATPRAARTLTRRPRLLRDLEPSLRASGLDGVGRLHSAGHHVVLNTALIGALRGEGVEGRASGERGLDWMDGCMSGVWPPSRLSAHAATHAADLEEAARAPGGVPRVAHQPVVHAALSAPADDADGVAAQGLAGGGARVHAGGVAARTERGGGERRGHGGERGAACGSRSQQQQLLGSQRPTIHDSRQEVLVDIELQRGKGRGGEKAPGE